MVAKLKTMDQYSIKGSASSFTDYIRVQTERTADIVRKLNLAIEESIELTRRTLAMSRILPLRLEEMSAEQKRVHDLVASGPRGRVRGPLAIWLHRPAMAEHAQALGQFCRYGSSLPPRLSELGILTLACVWGSEYEWWAHKPLGLAAGLSDAVVDALRDSKPPPFEHEDEKLVYTFLTTLHETRRVPEALYARAQLLLRAEGMIDLVALAGYYTLISMTLNVFEIELPDGELRELKQARCATGLHE